MKKTFNIDDKLLKMAKRACGAKTDTDTIRLGLERLVQHAAAQRLRRYLGSEPDAQMVPRRREKPARKRGAGTHVAVLIPDQTTAVPPTRIIEARDVRK
jgi:Arc/MetJ family transcription regulator